jgi:hypothetical protein
MGPSDHKDMDVPAKGFWKSEKKHNDNKLDEALKETFPASDPTSPALKAGEDPEIDPKKTGRA